MQPRRHEETKCSIVDAAHFATCGTLTGFLNSTRWFSGPRNVTTATRFLPVTPWLPAQSMESLKAILLQTSARGSSSDALETNIAYQTAEIDQDHRFIDEIERAEAETARD